MKFKTVALKFTQVIAFIVFTAVLLVTGVVIMLYSGWTQENLRKALVAKFSTQEMDLRLDNFRLRFPLSVEADGLAILTDGDTAVAASQFKADVALLPLLTGEVRVKQALARDLRYRMGTPDSAMYMTIAADSLLLDPVNVVLGDMDIDLSKASIVGGRVAMVMNQDTTPPTPPAPPTKMNIKIGNVALDNFDFSMRMLPTIDTLSARITEAQLKGGIIDLYNQRIQLGSFSGSELAARYIVPDSATIAATPVVPSVILPDSLVSAPWTVEIDSISFDDSRALYTTAGVEPLPGLDFAYIQVDSLNLKITDFYNQATTVRLPLELSGTERCGVRLNIDGELDIDSVAMTFKTVMLTTPEGTLARIDGMMGMGDMTTDPDLPLSLEVEGALASSDLAAMFPAFSPYFNAIPREEDIKLKIQAVGTTGHLDISELALDLNHCISLDADGYIENFMNPDELGGNINISGRIVDVNSFKNAVLDRATAKTINIPPMIVNGHVAMNRGIVNGNVHAAVKGGDIRMKARWNSVREAYTLDLSTNSFPVQSFMPLLGVENVTAALKVDGHGYSPFKRSTSIVASADVSHLVYMGAPYDNIKADVKLAEGIAEVNVVSDSEAADATLWAKGNLDGKEYKWQAKIDGRYIDLYALHFMTVPASLELMLTADATIGPGTSDIEAKVRLDDVFYRTEESTIALSDINARLSASDSLTSAFIINRDLTANFSAPYSIDSLTAAFGRVATELADQLKIYSIQADSISRVMPQFSFVLKGGNSNMVNDVLAASKMSVRNFGLNISNDSIFNMQGTVYRFDTGSMTLDTIFINMHEHVRHYHLDAGIINRPGNMDEWHKISLNGAAEGNQVGLRLSQQNIKGKTGFDIGMVASASPSDTSITLRVKPLDPIIGYQQWTANDSNFITYTIPTKHIDANLFMKGANSSLSIYTEEVEENHNHKHEQEDLVVKLGNIHLQDWIVVNPFAPPIKGDVNADMRLNRHDDMIVGNGSLSLVDFLYGKERIADFKTDFDIAASPSGKVIAKADVMVNGVKTMTLSGALNDSTALSPLALDFSVIHFPLDVANPFIPASMGRLSGMLNGNLKISGTDARPVFNGTLEFDSTAVRLALTGTSYKFSPSPIEVRDNLVTLRDFAISGCNENPLNINGTVDISDLANMRMNLAMKADNMMIVDTKRASKGADIFGKGYISLDASAHGSMRFLQVNANLSVNSETNITYVIPDATNAVASQSTADMVKFVNFTDSLAVVRADSITSDATAIALDAVLTLEQGSIVNVYLNTDGSNRVQLQPNGTLSYSMSPLDNGRLTGRLNIEKGYVRYTPPFMSEKLFNFNENSYVSFMGDMMNPTLNIHAVDVLKANVTSEGQNSRLVNFDVSLAVTGALNQMNVAFDLSTDDDMTVANELESMSAEQRANQAMNMLLYNVYSGPGAKGNAKLTGNPVFSFLESQLNNWAANNIRGVDVSFGINQYDRTVNGSTASTMSYSYQVSKALFNDRFKIVVGGNYSTDANADENFSQNLINDISFEYFLNKTRTMYLRLFRHTGYESILEGEITRTGVGFVYRRKLRRVGDMFLPESIVKKRIEKQNAILETKVKEEK